MDENTAKHVIEIAAIPDADLTQEFAAFIRGKGHKATVGPRYESFVDGSPVNTNFVAAVIYSTLWREFCDADAETAESPVEMTATEYMATLSAMPEKARSGSISVRTPGLFVSTKHQASDGNPVFDISADGVEIASVYLPAYGRSLVANYYNVQEANAEFICRACNAHNDLVKALERVLGATGSLLFEKDRLFAEAAIAKAGAA